MSEPRVWTGQPELPEYQKNLAEMLTANSTAYKERPIFKHIVNDSWQELSWSKFYSHLLAIQACLKSIGFKPGDRMAILSPNCQSMLELELAVMSMGGVAVPIFPGYPADKADALLTFCDARFAAVADKKQYAKIAHPEKLEKIIWFEKPEASSQNALLYSDMLLSSSNELLGLDVSRDRVCLMMYTSGTMGLPKCVQLTHGNILSQQAAMKVLWQLTDQDRFLSYLPWHHSFGGIYEKYAAIANGAVLALESGFGKNIEQLIENWKAVKPTVFFSVPRIYQEIATMVRQDPELEKLFFHDELRFVFTAAAPLPKNISDLFEQRSVPVYEGWGLTETSPCCTVTDPEVTRLPGVVGKPIPGVTITLSDENEIMVKGPNVMVGYYNNSKETSKVFTDDGWFATGDVGEFTETGLRLISRKDRIFKLSNAEKVVPTEIENLIVRDCPYLSHAYVTGSGRDHPVVLLFPNKKMFKAVNGDSFKQGCVCPDGMKDFASCLGNCLDKMNNSLDEKFACVKSAMLVDHELSIEQEELTPSMKVAPNVLAKVFKANIELLYNENCNSEKLIDDDKVFLIELESK